MVNAVRDTSLEQWLKILEDPIKLGTKQQEVYDFIKANPFCCDKEISEGLGIKINCTT